MTVRTLCLTVLLLGCSTGAYKKGKSYLESGDYTSAIYHLQVAESSDPYNWQIKRDLGIAYFKNSQTRKAEDKLLEAFRRQRTDAMTLLYLGQCYENLQAHDKGITLYKYFAGQRISNTLRAELNARIRELERTQARAEAAELIRTYQNNTTGQIKPNSVAVLYLRNVSNWTELTPLLKGLSEVLTSELQSEARLAPVSRLKIQSVLEQLNLSPEEFLDRYTMIEIARLLQVSYVISGGIERISDVQLQINMGLLEGRTGKLVGSGISETCRLSDLLAVVTDATPKLLAHVGIKRNESPAVTKNNLAFIAFSKGLDYEDKLLFPQAREQYQKAVTLDPEFTLARTRLGRFPENRLTLAQMEDLAFHLINEPDDTLQLGLK